MTLPFQDKSASDGDECCHNEGEDIILLIVIGYQQTDEEQECLDEKQLPQDLVYKFTVYHFI